MYGIYTVPIIYMHTAYIREHPMHASMQNKLVSAHTNLFPSQHTCKWSLILQVFYHQLQELATGQMVQFHLENCIQCVFTRTRIKNMRTVIQFSNFLLTIVTNSMSLTNGWKSSPVPTFQRLFFFNLCIFK